MHKWHKSLQNIAQLGYSRFLQSEWNVWVIKAFGFVQWAIGDFREGERKISFDSLQIIVLKTVVSLLLDVGSVCLLAAKYNVVRSSVRNGPVYCLQIKYVKSLSIRTATRRNVTHLVRKMKKWSHAHHRPVCQFTNIIQPRFFPSALLRMKMPFKMWQVNSHNLPNGHCPFPR